MTLPELSAELLPCPNPWCASHDRRDAEIFEAHRPILMPSRASFEWAVACPVCPIETPWFGTGAEAITAWNTRSGQLVERDGVAGVVEALRLFPEAHDVLTRQEMRDAKGNWRSLIDQQTNALASIRAALTAIKGGGDDADG